MKSPSRFLSSFLSPRRAWLPAFSLSGAILLSGVSRGEASPPSAGAPSDAAVLRTEFLYDTGPYPQVHASTLVETPKGLVAAWFGGTREGHKDVCIWVSRQLPSGEWTPGEEAANGIQANGGRYPTWNPVLFQPRQGALLLFYKVGPSPEAWWGELKTSEDGGNSWSPARRLPEGIYGPIKNKPVQLADGDLLCPTSYEAPPGAAPGGDGKAGPRPWQIYFERTPDLGKTWTRTEWLHDGRAISAIQPSVLFLGGEHLLALGRTRQQRVFQIESQDAGRTWGKMTLTALPNPNSGTDAVTLRDGRHLLVYNHTTSGRSPLNLALSRDGRDWEAALVLESEPGEYSYPAIIQTRDGLVHVSYTWKRKKVRHVVLDPARLSPKPFVHGEWPK
jgi:predicted neuraminidase